MAQIKLNKAAQHFCLFEMFKNCSEIERMTAIQSWNTMSHLFQLVQILNQLRADLSSLHMREIPIYINSGFRDSGHNARVGGVSSSDHLTGAAVDFHCEYLEDAFNILSERYVFGQLIRYDSFIHVSLVTTKHYLEIIDKRSKK